MVSPVKTVAQDIRRLRSITGVLTRHGFSAVATRAGLGRFITDETKLLEAEASENLLGDDTGSAAVRFRNVLEDLGPTFVKLGQILSTRPDIMPKEFMDELQNLQDRVPPMSFEDVEIQVERNFDAPIDEIFDQFDEDPIGAASIGQVHRAITKEGQECVVKVQRPGIAEKIRSDLDLLYYLARFLEATIEEVELYTPTAIVKEFERAILTELDFNLEARNLTEFRKNFEDNDKVGAPKVFESLTTKQVLTMEFVNASKLADIEGGTDRAHEILDELLDSLVQQVLYHGFFHGDPHPGNIMVTDENQLVFIDFGLIGRMSEAQQDEVINLIITVLTGDVDGISRTILRMGHPVGRVNLKEFKADVVRIRDEYLVSSLSDINVTEFVQDIIDAAQYHRIRLNPTYAVLTKTAMTIEGIMRTLEPDLDVVGRATPYVKELTMRRFSARKIMQGALRTGFAVSGFAQQLPEQMDQILMDLESGNLTFSVRNESLDKIGQHLNTLGTRIFLGITSAGLAVSAALLLQGVDYAIYDIPLVIILGALCAAMASLLFWWTLSWHIVGGKDSSKLRLAPLMRLFRSHNDGS